MVSSCHPLATLAGVETLKAGGTAADAAVATNAVLAVTQSNNCGLGGDLFCLYYEAATRPRALPQRRRARRARARRSTSWRRRGMTGLPVIGPGHGERARASRARGPCCSSASARARSTGCWLRPSTMPSGAFPSPSLLSQGIARVRAGQSRSRSGGACSSPAGVPRRRARCSCSRISRARCATSASEGPDLFYRGRVAQAIAERMAADGLPHRRTIWPRTAASGASPSPPPTAASRSTRRRRRRRGSPR